MTLLSFDELNEISHKVLANFDEFIRFFDLDIRDCGNSYVGCCPIHHGSDNPSAFVMYKNTGVWRCNTHGCHNIFKKSPIGLIRGIMSKERLGWHSSSDYSKMFAFMSAVKFVNTFFEKTPKSPIRHRSRARPVVENQYLELNISPSNFLSRIECPATYYLNRGFNSAILRRYMVGYYGRPYRQLSNRVLVPVMDDTGSRIIGCCGRTIHDKCMICSGYHKPTSLCPDRSESWHFQKWKNSKGFRKSKYLYNMWSARQFIKAYGEIILVEGPSEVWKLEEAGIRNSVAIFGSDINRDQAAKISKLNPSQILTIMDDDDGGLAAQKSCNNRLSNFNIQHLTPLKNDVGDMSVAEIKSWLA